VGRGIVITLMIMMSQLSMMNGKAMTRIVNYMKEEPEFLLPFLVVCSLWAVLLIAVFL
jgi:hypothetical protein